MRGDNGLSEPKSLPILPPFPGTFILPVEVGLIYSLPFHLTFYYYYYYLFIFGCAGSLLLVSFSLVVMNRDSSLVAVNGFLIAVASLVAEHWP